MTNSVRCHLCATHPDRHAGDATRQPPAGTSTATHAPCGSDTCNPAMRRDVASVEPRQVDARGNRLPGPLGDTDRRPRAPLTLGLNPRRRVAAACGSAPHRDGNESARTHVYGAGRVATSGKRLPTQPPTPGETQPPPRAGHPAHQCRASGARRPHQPRCQVVRGKHPR